MATEKPDNIARHTVKGSAYSVASSAVTIVLGFVRATLMARLLASHKEYFGVATLALFYLEMAMQFGTIGLGNAFIHRKEVDEKVRAMFFTMNLLLTLSCLGILGLFTPLIVRFYPTYSQLGAVIFAYMGIELIKMFNDTQTTILSKDLAFGRLAIVDTLSSVVMTIVGPLVAVMGGGVWSILAERFSGNLTRAITVWIIYKPWRPRLTWDWPLARWFWNYGVKVWWMTNLTFLIDRFDDFWTGTVLGVNALGVYSKAYEFARYPRRVVANPILEVFFPTFAHLQEDRLRLSRAFFRATSLIFRAGCLFSLAFILTAPEFIRIFLTDAWLPMQTTFQLMIIYTLLDPINLAAHRLLTATGHPELVLRTRIFQTIIFIPAVIVFASWWGIEGVALAADGMVFVGTIWIYRYTLQVVDYSMRKLWLWPAISMGLTAGVLIALNSVWVGLPVWGAFLGKLILSPLLYGGLLLLTEREQLLSGWTMLWGLVKPKLKET